ncbi:hypothetical protein ABZ897_35045 [Nonomuraea sp. NPDC046802]|uniref:hypothetical protein n=1 Tax=Nonomuraea sp. NPDC046802 TaxID=3154919 RepID=UPI003406EBEC
MSERLIRTSYVDPTVNPPEPRQGNTGLHESRQDQEGYFGPQHRLHGSLHGWGVAAGLRVSAVIGQAGLRISPGAALDVRGRLLPLAAGGQAKLDDDTLVPITENGVALPTAGAGGEHTLTIGWAETFDYTGVGSGVFNTETTPVLRLRADAVPDDGEEVVLARVALDAAGNVTGLAEGARRVTGIALGRIVFLAPSAEDAEVGQQQADAELRAIRDGGLVLAADRLDVQEYGGPQPPLLSLHLADKRIGIGTDTPAADLDVRRTTVFRRPVGFGTDHPQAPIDVDGDVVVRNGVIMPAAGNSESAGILFPRDPGGGAADRAYIRYFPVAGEDTKLIIGNDNDARDVIAFRQWNADLMTLTGGMVGIGTTAPEATLDVWGRALVRDRFGVGLNRPLGRLHVVAAGGFGGEDGDGVLADSNVPLLAQSDATAIGILNSKGRPAFALNIDGNEGTPRARGIPTLYDRFDGEWRPGLSLKLGMAGFGTFHPSAKVEVLNDTPWLLGLKVSSPRGFGLQASGSIWAAHFEGNVNVNGTLTKSSLEFKIDHPLDPAGRYLSHGAVESDEMKNVYDGEVVLDEHGAAEVTLPGWFEALNERFRYQLTPIGAPAPNLHIAAKLSGNRFTIAGGEPGGEVCWQVTGVRHDPYALANPLVVESAKEGDEHGRYRHPQAHGLSADLAVGPSMTVQE